MLLVLISAFLIHRAYGERLLVFFRNFGLGAIGVGIISRRYRNYSWIGGSDRVCDVIAVGYCVL
jgi:hypothetical protein